MSSEFFLKRSNRLPVVEAQLSDSTGYINLSGVSSVEFLYREKPNGSMVTGSATIYNSDNGIVQYAWTTGDVSTAGVYWCEWRATFNNGKTITFPNDSYITFEILEDLR